MFSTSSNQVLTCLNISQTTLVTTVLTQVGLPKVTILIILLFL